MPQFPTLGGGQGITSALSQQGIPQPITQQQPAPSSESMSEIIQMLRGGQVGADRFIELLGLLAGETVPNIGQASAPQPQQGAAPSITDLLG